MTKKMISWNVNGLRATLKNGFSDFIEDHDPDVLCLQETKINEPQECLALHGYHRYWSYAQKKGYSGTAIFTKEKPICVSYGIGVHEHDNEGRVIIAEYKDYFVVCVYVPNSGRGLPRLSYRETWDEDFLSHMRSLEKKKPVIICGDLNVAHTEIDLANPKSNYNKTAGYTQKEIDGFKRMLDAGFVDTFREFEKGPGHYTYWGMWNNLRARNIGWRIDYFIVSPALKNRVKRAFILPEVMGSDHCPVGIEID